MPRVDAAYLEARRNQIIDAAMTCFGRDGFHRTTMQDIVRESGLSAGALYRYFKSKEDIVAAIADDRRNPDPALLDAISDAPDVREALRTLVHGSLSRLSDPTERRWRRIAVQVWAEALRDRRVMRIIRKGNDEPLELLTTLIERGQSDGTFPRDIDAAGAARVCASMFYGLVLQQAWEPSVDVDGYVETVLRLLDALIVGDRKKTTASTR